ncbi:MAG: carboxypeptidase regulatory-like domain-containing protein [Bacteroidales bacterium]|nr:carboxypeptidase regulatory-like domain-containing protein [Bacteroidales bacterium]
MKKHIKFLGLALILSVGPFITHAQYRMLKKANDYYNHLAFNEAIPRYMEVLKKDSMNSEALIKLADCYRLINNNPKALETYAKVIGLNEALPLHRFLYAQALMIAGRYEEAKVYMNSYTADDRGRIFSKSIENIWSFYKDAELYHTKKVCFNSSKNDFSPAIWLNNRIVFTSSRTRATMVSYKNAWTGDFYDALYITSLNKRGKFRRARRFNKDIHTRYNVGAASFSTDGKHIYFTRNNIIENEDIRSADGKVNLKIFQATLDKYNQFGNTREFFYNSAEYNCAHPAINTTENILYFSSDMPGGYGGMDIWMSKKTDTTWSQPVNLGSKINTAGNEVFPYNFNDKSLYFSSNGLDGMGGLDIYKVDIYENGIPHETVVNIGAPINSPFDDFGIVFNTDGESGYYSSNFGNINNDDDIYEFTVLKPETNIKIQGTVTDNQTREVISEAKVILKDLSGSVIDEVFTDVNGNYSITAAYGKDYTILCQKDKYSDAMPKSVSTSVNEEITEIRVNLGLEKKTFVRLVVSVTDSQNNDPIENVKIEILNNKTNLIEIFSTSANGNHIIELPDVNVGDSLNYKISLSKDGYISKVIDWMYFIAQIQDISLNEKLNKAQLGTSLDDVIVLNPIYFDLDKHNIRPDAAIELDKVVAFMMQNPTISIELGSHTDCRATAAYNLTLSEKRAKSSVDYIVSKGISRNRLKAKGWGETMLNNHCACEGDIPDPCTEEEHAKNRRTEFLIYRIQ